MRGVRTLGKSGGGLAVRLSVVSLFICACFLQAGEPYLPTSDSEVLERLPATPFSRDQLAQVRSRLAEEPQNVVLATAAANSFIKMGKSTGDPRFFGYARASLEVWWDDPEAPTGVMRYRAELKEREHEYAGAIADLETVLAREPEDAQALVDLANNFRVIGEYAKAEEVSARLGEFANEFQQAVARLPLMAVTGSAQEAYALAGEQREFALRSVPDSLEWVIGMQAETARILGEIDQADVHFREAINASQGSAFAKRAYGEFLLDHGRPAEAMELLGEPSNDNGALLLAALAARDSGETELAAEWQAQLEKRFEELRMRGGEPHGRFEAQAMLELDGDAAGALKVAVANWERQKEARDSRLVLMAAIAAGEPGAAREVIEFLRANQTEDVELVELIEELEAK